MMDLDQIRESDVAYFEQLHSPDIQIEIHKEQDASIEANSRHEKRQSVLTPSITYEELGVMPRFRTE